MSDSSKVIFFIDDDELIIRASKLWFNSTEYKTYYYNSGIDAINDFASLNPLVIISDIKMPKIDGIQLLDAIKNLDNDIPIIFITAFANIELAVQAMNKGAFDFIQKPFKPDHLLHKINKAYDARILSLQSKQWSKWYKRMDEKLH